MHRSQVRFLSQTGAMWVNKFRYGFENAPVFGSLHPRTTDDHAQRLMYSKALVYASGGSRLARDWLAGCAALSLSDGEIVQVALQHDGTYFDVLALEAHLVRRESVQRASPHAEAFSLLHGRVTGDGVGAESDDGSSKLSSNSSEASSSFTSSASITDMLYAQRAAVAAAAMSEYDPQFHSSMISNLTAHDTQQNNNNNSRTSSSSSSSSSALDDPTLFPLTKNEASTIRRCFVYDAVKASSFQTAKLSEIHVAHLEGVCRMLGLHILASPAAAAASSQQSGTTPAPAESASLWTVRTGHELVTVCPFLMEVMAIVEEENRLMREKFRVIDQR